MYYKTSYESPLGTLTLASDGDNLTGLWNDAQKYHGDTLFRDMEDQSTLPVFAEVKAWLEHYFAGEQPAISELPLAPAGSGFRQEVWDMLCKIPYGALTTYGDLAKRMAVTRGKERMSSQAVGGAVGHNPISIIIPCHRVVGSNGSLTGYAGGIDIKIMLLEHERVDMTDLFVPAKGTAL